MPKEIELKLRLNPSQARRLAKHPVLAGWKPQKYTLFNTYYDTPGFDLRRRGIALRLRRKGTVLWLMTVKGGDAAVGGLAQRCEWEAPTQPGVFDFSIVTDAGLREFLESHRALLQPVFSTDFTRTAWTLDYAGSRIELALDRGVISASRFCTDATSPEKMVSGPLYESPSEPICEIELELLEGESPDALFALAIELASDLHLHPETASKAERGYALADGVKAPPVKAPASSVYREMTPIAAFRAVAFSCLFQLQRNEQGAMDGAHPEYVHQARVAIRRLRSAFKVFSPVLSPRFVDIYAPRWSQLASRLGGARDWDVFIAETLEPLEDAFPGDPDLARLRARSEASQMRAQASAGVALRQRDYSQLVLAFSAALFRDMPPTIEATGKYSAMSLRRFAARRLQRRAMLIEQLISEHGKMDAGRRHQLRIAFKKLRYALEFFAPILPNKRLATYLASLAAIQDMLGNLNDQVTASRLIMKMQPAGRHVPLTKGWIAGRTHLLVAALTAELRRFMALRKPW